MRKNSNLPDLTQDSEIINSSISLDKRLWEAVHKSKGKNYMGSKSSEIARALAKVYREEGVL